VVSKQDGGTNNANNSVGETSRIPPFPTKEPERYQATQIETISDGAHTVSYQIFIARDGERRRVDLTTPTGGKISRLELPSGIYLLAPDQKIYTEADNLKTAGGKESGVPADFVPDKLLNESIPESHYEKVGTETVNGRMTTKYRVTLVAQTGPEKKVTSESLIWVDESLGMPIKSEMTSTGDPANGIVSGDRVTMELRDISETVDASLFELADYRKVDGEAFYKTIK